MKLFLVFLFFRAILTSYAEETYICETTSSSYSLLRNLEGIKQIFTAAMIPGIASDKYMLPFGVKVETSCRKLLEGKGVDEAIQGALKQGLQCLSNLNGTQSQKAILNINALLLDRSKPPTLFCSIDPSTGAGEASLPPAPPIIYIDGKDYTKQDDIRKFQTTYFHELLHNAGFGHGEGFEMSYTCEDCCFNTDQQSIKIREAACRACGTKSDDPTDDQYAKDLVAYYLLTQPYIGFEYLTTYSLKKPNAEWVVEILKNNDMYFSKEFQKALQTSTENVSAKTDLQKSANQLAQTYLCILKKGPMQCKDKLQVAVLDQKTTQELSVEDARAYDRLLQIKLTLLKKLVLYLDSSTKDTSLSSSESRQMRDLSNEINQSLGPNLAKDKKALEARLKP